MPTITRAAGVLLGIVALAAAGAAQEPTRPASVVIPPETLGPAFGEPLSARALVTKPLPITGVTSWSLETRRHRGQLWSLAVSPDGRTVATGGLDGTVRLWDAESGKLVRALIGHDSYASSIDWSPDGNTLATAGTWDITVRLWDVRSGRPLRVLKGHPAETTRVRWSPDGRSVVVSGGRSGAVTCWNAVTGAKRSTVELGQYILSLAWHPDGSCIAIGGQGMPVQVWDPEKNKVLRSLGSFKEAVLAVAFSHEAKTVAAGTAKATLLLDAVTGKTLHTVEAGGHGVAWFQGGKQLATLAPDALKLWDGATYSPLASLPVTGDQYLAAAGTMLVSASLTGFAVHDGAAAKTLRRFDNLAGTLPPWWWPGKVLLTGVGTPRLTLWDPDTGKRLHDLDGHKAAVTAAALAPGAKTLATAGQDKAVCLWEVGTGKLGQTLTGHKAAALAVAFSSDGKQLASGGADNLILVWDPAASQPLHTLKGSERPVSALAWKPGSSTALVSNGLLLSAQLWNVRTGAVEKTLDGQHEFVSLAWAPDGSRIAGGQGNGSVVIWGATSGKVLHQMDKGGSPPQVSSLAWAPGGLVLAAGRSNHTLQLWDPKAGKELRNLQTMAPVQRVGWTPGGSTFVVSSLDRTARFFDLATGKLRGVLLAEDDQVLAVHFDGHYRAPAPEGELYYVVQTRTSQDTYTPAEFAAKYKLRNAPAKVVLTGK